MIFQPDPPGQRTCGTCMECKLVSEFYKDGTDGDGNTKYRRDCKSCYNTTRAATRKMKRKAAAPPRRKRR